MVHCFVSDEPGAGNTDLRVGGPRVGAGGGGGGLASFRGEHFVLRDHEIFFLQEFWVEVGIGNVIVIVGDIVETVDLRIVLHLDIVVFRDRKLLGETWVGPPLCLVRPGRGAVQRGGGGLFVVFVNGGGRRMDGGWRRKTRIRILFDL